MILIGIVETCSAIPACRDGCRVEVCVNDGVIMMVIRVFPVARRQMHVLVRRHKERQQWGGRHK